MDHHPAGEILAWIDTPPDAHKDQKILCVCENGNVRSVGTRRRLSRRRYHNVIAIGAANTKRETLRMLIDWSDVILVAEPWLAELLPPTLKIDKRFEIGPDVFGNSNNRQLQDIVKLQLDKLGLR